METKSEHIIKENKTIVLLVSVLVIYDIQYVVIMASKAFRVLTPQILCKIDFHFWRTFKYD